MELTRRGKKDAYFIQNPQVSWFGTTYEQRSPSVKEVRYQYPTSPAVFNDTVDIELPAYGDIITRIDIQVDLPSWLPESLVAVNRDPTKAVYNSWIPSHVGIAAESPFFRDPVLPNGLVPGPDAHVSLTEGAPPLVGYGYVDGVGDLVFSKWELYADNYKLAEGFPLEYGTWYPSSQSTQNALPVRNQRGAYHRGRPYDITSNATPTTVTCSIPIPGCQREHDTGFPICALRNQRLMLRLRLRPLRELVESTVYFDSSGEPVVFGATGLPIYDPCPTPWGGRPLWIYDVSSGSVTLGGYSTAIWAMDYPAVAARLSVLHIDDDSRRDLMSRRLELYFQKQYTEQIIFDSRNWFVGAQISRQFEIKGFFEFLVLRFQADARLKENKYLDLLPPQIQSATPTEWFSELSLVINARERIQPWDSRTLRVLANGLQLPTDVPDGQYYLMFGQLADGEPAGNLLLSRSHKVNLNVVVAAVPDDPAVTSGQVNLSILGLSWNVIDIQDSFAKVRYPD